MTTTTKRRKKKKRRKRRKMDSRGRATQQVVARPS